MKIDAHRHYWRYIPEEYGWISEDLLRLRHDFLPEQAADLDAALGVDAVIAVQARAHERENDFLLELAGDSNICGIVGWVDLCAREVSQRLDVYREMALIRGFRHLVQDEADPSAFWARRDFNQGVAALQARGFVYDVLVRQADLPAAAAFCRRQDKAFLVIDHLAKPDFRDFSGWQRQMRELAQMPHVAVKISGLLLEAGKGADADSIKPYVDSALSLFGCERCMLGSDDPVCLLSHERAEVAAWWQGVLNSLTEAQARALGGETAARIYGV